MFKLILLPGMDGTGKLFEPLVRELGTTFAVEVVHYPTDQFLSYADLEGLVEAAIPKSEPFVLVAESYSTPVAVMCASHTTANLKGLAICAGFVRSPLRGWRRFAFSRLAPFAFGRTLPDAAAKWFLVGSNAAPSLLGAVRSAVTSAEPGVLVQRVRAILMCDVSVEFARVYAPILYLQAEQDRLVGSGCLDEIRRIKPHLTVERIPGPHLLLQREPVHSAAAINAWLRKISQCTICGRNLDVESEPLSGDCGGDCWGCVSQVEADLIGVPVDRYRENPANFLPRDWPSVPRDESLIR